MPTPLSRLHVTCLANYIPALVASQRLRAFGATITVVEPASGDPFATLCPAWYRALHAGVTTARLDLKTGDGAAALAETLADSDALITALRPSALERLGLGWNALQARYPRLVHVAVVGYPAPDSDEPGHDLTYQARSGLLRPPDLPLTLIADLAGAERAAQAVLALLLGRERSGTTGRLDVALADAADAFADAVRFGITAPTAVLGGGFPGYAIYRSQDGWLALAALEPHFWRGVLEGLDVADDANARDALTRIFAGRTSAAWEAWAQERDLPLTGIPMAARSL
jgi:crotonobetainyl-CoA:carnitine CoA-transferase CaiB-like acyl-CoA transferase